MDYVQAVELLRHHRPPLLWRLRRDPTCRACGLHWQCAVWIEATAYVRKVEVIGVGEGGDR